MADPSGPKCRPISRIIGGRIFAPNFDASKCYDLTTENGHIAQILFHDSSKYPKHSALPAGYIDARDGGIITPTLCHAHVHLDKAFLTSHPKYADLAIERGGFGEAMDLGRRAKSRFEEDDLIIRGKWLIAESIASGVSHMRAFVEVDYSVEFKCLDAALELKSYFADYCEIQICAFAQDPLFSGSQAEINRRLFNTAINRVGVDVLGTTPYVEDSANEAMENISYAVASASKANKHLDFHLDYNIDPKQPSMVHHVLAHIERANWRRSTTNRSVALGHCTRLTLFSKQEWQELAKRIKDKDLPIYFIGLPTSDLFIQGKPSENSGGGERTRGTLQIPQMMREYGIHGTIAINNVGNSFTPQGSCDPLALASWGVGIYQAGTRTDVECLFECVSSFAKKAIGFDTPGIETRAQARFIIFRGDVGKGVKLSTHRSRLGMHDLVYDPPRDRTVIFNGNLIEI